MGPNVPSLRQVAARLNEQNTAVRGGECSALRVHRVLFSGIARIKSTYKGCVREPGECDGNLSDVKNRSRT